MVKVVQWLNWEGLDLAVGVAVCCHPAAHLSEERERQVGVAGEFPLLSAVILLVASGHYCLAELKLQS